MFRACRLLGNCDNRLHVWREGDRRLSSLILLSIQAVQGGEAECRLLDGVLDKSPFMPSTLVTTMLPLKSIAPSARCGPPLIRPFDLLKATTILPKKRAALNGGSSVSLTAERIKEKLCGAQAYAICALVGGSLGQTHDYGLDGSSNTVGQ